MTNDTLHKLFNIINALMRQKEILLTSLIDIIVAFTVQMGIVADDGVSSVELFLWRRWQ